MFHVDMASTPRSRDRSSQQDQGVLAQDITAARTPYHGVHNRFWGIALQIRLPCPCPLHLSRRVKLGADCTHTPLTILLALAPAQVVAVMKMD